MRCKGTKKSAVGSRQPAVVKKFFIFMKLPDATSGESVLRGRLKNLSYLYFCSEVVSKVYFFVNHRGIRG